MPGLDFCKYMPRPPNPSWVAAVMHSCPFRLSAQPAAVLSLGLSSKPWVPACLWILGCVDLRLAHTRYWYKPPLHGSLCSACCRLVVVLSSEPLKLSFCPRGWSPCQQGGFLRAGTFPLFRLPPRGAGPIPRPVFFFVLSCPVTRRFFLVLS